MKLNNLYGVASIDYMGNSDIEGTTPWKIQSDLTFRKRLLKDGITICTKEYMANSPHYLSSLKDVYTVSENPTATEIEMIVNAVEANPDTNFFVIGNGKVFDALEDFISKYYITHVHGMSKVSTPMFLVPWWGEPDTYSKKLVDTVIQSETNQFSITIEKYTWHGKLAME